MHDISHSSVFLSLYGICAGIIAKNNDVAREEQQQPTKNIIPPSIFEKNTTHLHISILLYMVYQYSRISDNATVKIHTG